MHIRSEKSGGIFNSLRQLSKTAIELLLVRLALIGNDIEIEKSRIFRGLLFAVIATAALSMGILFLCILLIVIVGPDHQFSVIGALTALFLSMGVFFILQSRKLMTSADGIFGASTSELKSDLQHLRGNQPDA
jgi:uncharacterized membrane protein YqjE